MKNYISENISYLVKKSKLTQDDFGLSFDLKKGVINQYIQGKSLPKIETIQKICSHNQITIDDFINLDLSEQKYLTRHEQREVAEPAQAIYGNDKYVQSLENMIELQKDFIENQKDIINGLKINQGKAS